MKKISNNFKYILFSLCLIVVSFAFSQSVHADSYSYTCADGGTITSVVTIGPPSSPYPVGSSTPFTVTASMYSSSCGAKTVSLTAQNNSGAVRIIIPSQTLSLGGVIFPYTDTVNFTPPSSAGSYIVHFITAVSEGVFVRATSQDNETINYEDCYQSGTFNSYPLRTVSTTLTAQFFSDAAGTIPLDVTGQNLKMKVHGQSWPSIGAHGEDTYLSDPMSGTSHLVVPQYISYQDVTWEWGQPANGSLCNTNQDWASVEVLNGSSETVPYTLIP